MADEVTIVVRAKDEFSSTLGNFGNIMTGIKSTIDLVADGFRVFAGFAMEGLDAIASYERLSISLHTLAASQELMSGAAGTMTQAMTMTTDVAKELLTWTQKLAIESPFTQEGVAKALQMAMAYGFTVDEARNLVQAEIDYVAGSGKTEYAMEAISRALGQISATGKLTGQDMLQLTSQGVPVAEILAKAFNVTTAEIIKMRSDGLLPAQEVIKAITDWMGTNFAGAAKSFTESWAGLMGTFQDLKAMGLREFFGGLFDALQPLAVEMSTWLQTEGMDKLAEWGKVLGEFTAQIVSKLPDAINYIGQLKSVFDAGGLTATIGFVFKDFSAQDIMDFTDKLDVMLADAIDQGVASGAFEDAGNSFGNMLISLTGGLDSKQSEAVPAISEAISNFFEGAVGSVYFEHSAGAIAGAFVTVLNQSIQNSLRDASNDFNNALIGYFTNTLPDAIRKVNTAFNQAAKDMWQGFVDGLNFNIGSFDMGKWANDHIVIPIKNLLGIASPSTLFMGIGRDIVLGLIAGFGSAIGSFISIVQSFIDMVLQLFAPVLSIFGIDLGTSTGTGTTGGGAGTHAGPGGTSTTGSVVNNFYGPVYFGDMSSIGYDCPSPSPLVAASANTLIRSGIG